MLTPRFSLLKISVLMLFMANIWACQHDPVSNSNNPDPVNPTDPPVVSTTCDPDTVYFQNTILPLLVSNCTESGCHNATDHAEGIVLTSYQQILTTVENVTLNDWGENKLIKSLEDDEIDERMPSGKPAFTADQINQIKIWILQGAKNNSCDENSGGCDVVNGSKYSTFIQPLIQSKCKGCHSGAAPQGGISLANYQEVKAVALTGQLYNSVTKTTAWMPKGGAQLNACSIDKIKAWVDGGALEN